ncbi:PHD finger protein 11 isoform X2 [Myxocyprinus asiaticus]|uniref:PHD finger protein 11 isoform X2 n=1 Tax=Myxocyprinus asiaticus TaxID=70543 RepID=UPI002223C457|nr:PHD finger protein 11 isoform X2 [Myxocyprinus asiaticus]
MGSDQYRAPCKMMCVLCQKSDETEITGALSSKENISAHQNCLLFASGIYCKNSPTYDDLFGFAVDDVKQELRRGKRLRCPHCGKLGATAGCDVKRCKYSYHYPCAIEAHGRAIEDIAKGSYKLFCKKHDPQANRTSSVNSSTSSPNPSRYVSADSNGRMLEKSESNSSTGSSEKGFPSMKKRKLTVTFIGSDDENQTAIDSMFAPVESDLDDSTPPKEHNSEFDSPTRSPEVETPRRKKTKLFRKTGLAYSDDEIQCCTENTRPCEELNPSSTGADCDDTDIDSDVSQSLLLPYTGFMESGLSMESAAVCNSPGSVVVSNYGESPPTTINAPEPNAPTTNPKVSVSADPTPCQDHSSDVPLSQPGSPNQLSSTAGIPDVQPLPASDDTTDHPPELSPQPVASTSPDCLAAADACSVDAMASSESSAAIFWARCNEAGCTKEIFSDLVSQLSSLGERVQSQEASHNDYNVALKVLEASGRLPGVIAQLEQDLEKQEQDLQRKKAALRDARAVLGVHSLN